MVLFTETGITEILKAIAELVIATGTVLGIIIGMRSKKVSKGNTTLIKEVHETINSGEAKRLKDSEELGNLKGHKEEREGNQNSI